MITENISTLKIHKLSHAQYERENDAGNIEENSLYLVPDADYSCFEVDELLANKADISHEHSYNDLTDKPDIPSVEGLATTEYVDEKVANIEVSGGGGVSSWNDLTDKPFGEDNKIFFEWDGSTEGLEAIDITLDDSSVTYYKVSDAILPKTDLIGATGTAVISGNAMSMVCDETMLTDMENGCQCTASSYGIYVLFLTSNLVINDVTLTTGVWVRKTSDNYMSKIEKVVLTTLDEKYIPDTVATTEYVDEKVANIEVSGGGVSSWNDLTDKPFGETDEPIENVILPQQDIALLNDNATVLCHTGIFIDDTVKVLWNGTEYICKVVTAYGLPAIGDIGYLDNRVNTAEQPFVIGYDISNSAFMIFDATNKLSTVNIQISLLVSGIIPLDKKYLPDHAHSWNDLTDKPFGEAKVNVFEEQELTFTYEPDMDLYLWSASSPTFVFEEGETYYLTLNGTEYTCVGKAGSFGGQDGVGIGNTGLVGVGDNTDEPFIIGVTSDRSMIVCFTIGTNSNSTNTIKICKEGIKIIDSQYLPDTIATTEYVDEKVANIEVSGGSGGVSSWNASEGETGYIEGRTHWVELVGEPVSNILEWDGDFTGKTKTIIYTEGDIEQGYVKLSDRIITIDQLEGAVVKIEYCSNSNTTPPTMTQTEVTLINGENVTHKSSNNVTAIMFETPIDKNNSFTMFFTESDFYQDGEILEPGIHAIYLINGEYTSIRLVSITITDQIFGGGEIEVVHKLDEKFLPDHAHSWNDLTDKPFYEETKNADIIPLADYTLMYDVEWIYTENRPLGLTIGNTYTVTYNGIEYQCVAEEYYGTIMVGNTGLLLEGGDTGEPFIIGDIPDQQCWVVQTFDDAPTDETATITISLSMSGEITVLQKVETKFLYQPDWNDNNPKSFSRILNKPFGTIWAGDYLIDEVVETYGSQVSGDNTICYGFAYNALWDFFVEGQQYFILVDDDITGPIYTFNGGSIGNVDDDGWNIDVLDGMIGWIVPTSEYEAGNTTKRFRVSAWDQYVVKIPSEYLPETEGGTSGTGLPEVTTDDNDALLQVVDGIWTKVTLAESTIATYIDNYINEALGGEY